MTTQYTGRAQFYKTHFKNESGVMRIKLLACNSNEQSSIMVESKRPEKILF